ncbi:ATP-binding cassette domain-containing protein [Bradyrhizobium sp. ARR65]|uniref:ATP-binding cassette domain-containing protein n=1 Tax=Bradyrhizobium sp. ARR65 TaxID=1040989 RepID=UPI000465D3FF|nr:ATP-binding cassette domain-containing protein [Bradyrhizobium sp. ARR65]
MNEILPPVANPQPAPPQRHGSWSEAAWLERLEAAVGSERRANSPVAAALPSLLVALGWPGTVRSLAALLPPPNVPLSMQGLERLLSDLGFRVRRISARGNESDTTHLRAGSLVQHSGAVAIYLGRPGGKDSWLVGGRVQDTFAPVKGDVIAAIEPDLDFHAADEVRPNWFRSLFEQMRDELFALFAMSTLINMVALTVSLYVMAVYSIVIPSGAAGSVWWIALFAVVAIVGGWALRIGRQVMMSRMSRWIGTRIGEAAMRKMLGFPLDMSPRFGVQNNVIRMRSFESARQFLSGLGGTYLIDYPFAVIFLLAIALMGEWLVFVPLVALMIYALLALPTADYVSSKSTAAGVASNRLEEMVGATFIGINAFRHAGSGSQWHNQLADAAREAAARNRDYAIAVARAQVIGQALTEFTVLATMCVGIVLVLEGLMNAGGLVASMMLIWRITTPAQQAFGSLVRLRAVRSSVAQLDQLMMTPAEHPGADIASPRGITRAALTVERLYYRPDADQEAALNGVSFTLPAGGRIAVVGPNASGKTALLECLAGLRRPQSGRVLVNGRDIRQFDVTEYRAWIGYVPQVVPALPMSVRDYLRLRAPALTDREALDAFRQVLGHDWADIPVFASIAATVLDRRLNPFNEHHAELKFRYMVAFVAATLGDPAILLLDGTGVGADPLWDKRIERYLDSIRGRTTVIWSPYSTAQIQSSDQMVVIERGTVLRAGPVTQAAARQQLAKVG